jgi:ribosomal protein S27AE
MVTASTPEGGDEVCWLNRLCPECGAMPTEDVRVCWRCGATLHEDDAEER